MRQPDLNLASPQMSNPNDNREIAAFTTRLIELFQEAFDHIQRVKILTVAPTATELQEFLSESDIVILHSATPANRRMYYKYQNVIYAIASA